MQIGSSVAVLYSEGFKKVLCKFLLFVVFKYTAVFSSHQKCTTKTSLTPASSKVLSGKLMRGSFATGSRAFGMPVRAQLTFSAGLK